MTQTFKELKMQCAEVGITLSALCREVGQDRTTVENWKDKEPKSIEIWRTLTNRLAEKKRALAPATETVTQE